MSIQVLAVFLYCTQRSAERSLSKNETEKDDGWFCRRAVLGFAGRVYHLRKPNAKPQPCRSRNPDHIYQDWKDGEITQQEYRTMKADYEQQSQRLSDILARLTAERAELANGVDQEHPALVAFMKFENIDGLSREILIELIDHIKVYENGNISVRFKFADELRRIAEYIEINTTTDPAVAG